MHRAAKEQSRTKVARGGSGGWLPGVENGKSKRRDYKRENFPWLTVSYRGLVEYQAEIGFRMADPGQTSLSLLVPPPSRSHRDLPLYPLATPFPLLRFP